MFKNKFKMFESQYKQKPESIHKEHFKEQNKKKDHQNRNNFFQQIFSFYDE